MQFHLASLFAIVAAIGAAAQTLQIDTPACLSSSLGAVEKALITSVQPGGEPSAAALVDFGEQSGNSLTWVVNIEAGTSIGLTIRDQTGTVANSAPLTVGSSSDSSCLSASLSVSEGSSTPRSTSTSAGSATTTGVSATTTGASSTSTRASGTSGSGSGSSSASATSAESSNAAVPFAQIGSAGAIGAFIAAVLA
ncbi:hypothetical protein A7U60_g8224 [Sanghuangporus baumii]|uniref:GPI anchored protein n=1 Tax=Sanghuangporus baumii TaxID=108892 RepID=A0A9Q5HRL1_SANBA|nr:hypothetical protein A7U60_g8224 [Sanghuangporus baumii]